MPGLTIRNAPPPGLYLIFNNELAVNHNSIDHKEYALASWTELLAPQLKEELQIGRGCFGPPFPDHRWCSVVIRVHFVVWKKRWSLSHPMESDEGDREMHRFRGEKLLVKRPAVAVGGTATCAEEGTCQSLRERTELEARRRVVCGSVCCSQKRAGLRRRIGLVWCTRVTLARHAALSALRCCWTPRHSPSHT